MRQGTGQKSICDLYRSRWAIETIFKEIKQTLQLHTFLGFSRNAIEWQLWSALPAYLLQRYQARLNEWDRTFKHFFTLVKGVVWSLSNLAVLIQSLWDSTRSLVPPPAIPSLSRPHRLVASVTRSYGMAMYIGRTNSSISIGTQSAETMRKVGVAPRKEAVNLNVEGGPMV